MRTADPVFVVGPGRSGTTLVVNILRNHPAFYCPDAETGYFTYLDVVRRRFDALGDTAWRSAVAAFIRRTVRSGFEFEPGAETDDGGEPLGPHVAYRDYGAAFRDALDTLAVASGRSRWADKSPHHVFATREIFRSVPDAMVVEIVRDPRGVVASRKTMREQIWTTDRFAPDERERKELENSADPFWDGLRWKEAVRAGAQGRTEHADRWLRLRYEDLVQDPPGTVRALCSFTRVAFTESMLAVPRGITGDAEMSAEPGGVAATSLDRWRTALSDMDVAIVQRVCRSEMDELGYEPVPTRTSSVRLWTATAGRSSVELLQRARRQLKFGGPRMVLESARQRLRQVRHLGTRRR
jgi:hypothetical protein